MVNAIGHVSRLAGRSPSMRSSSLTPGATLQGLRAPNDRGRPSGAWHLGEPLGAEPACGAGTLYRSVPDGWQRVLAATIELDTVVQVHVTDLVGAGGVDTVGVGRQVVLATGW